MLFSSVKIRVSILDPMWVVVLYITKASLLFVSICIMTIVVKEIVLRKVYDVCFGEPDVGVPISTLLWKHHVGEFRRWCH